MLKFDPPELRDDLARAIERWKRKVHVDLEDYFTNEFVDVTRPGFDAAEHEDRTITPETEFGLSLPEWDNVAVISCHSFIELTEEMEQAQLIERYACWTDRRYLLRVVPANDQTYVDFNRLLPEPESAEEREAQVTYIERAPVLGARRVRPAGGHGRPGEGVGRKGGGEGEVHGKPSRIQQGPDGHA